MKKLLFLFLTIFLISEIRSIAQDPNPLPSITVKKLIAPNNPTLYYDQSDSLVKMYKGQYEWTWLIGKSYLEKYYVPYNGAIKNVNLGNHSIKSISFIADTTYIKTGNEAIGTRFWDDTDYTTSLVLPNGVVLQDGHELFFDILNQTGSILADGKVASYDGAVGASGKIKAKYGIADYTIMEPNHILGIITETIPNGSQGKITYFGKVRGIQTNGANYSETWADGDVLFVSKTIYGGLTNIQPQAPYPAIAIAVVVKAHAINGIIMVRPTFPQRLEDLADVNGTPLSTSGQFPVWNNTNKYFDFNYNINNYEPTVTKGLLSENITGLEFTDLTRQVIGGATTLTTSSGYAIPTTTNISHGESGYDNQITSIGVSGTTTKTITLTQQDAGTITTNFNVTKSDVGLGNVDNTSDIDKPISNATQSALNGKENTLTKGNLTAGSTKVIIGGTGTGAVIGTGVSVDVNEANLSLQNMGGAVTDAQVPNTIVLDNITQITNRSHTNLSDIGTNTHAQIDTHITNDADLSITNEGQLTVVAGIANTSIINSNTSGQTGVTIGVGGINTISESGNTITITATEVPQAPTRVGDLIGLTQTTTTIDISDKAPASGSGNYIQAKTSTDTTIQDAHILISGNVTAGNMLYPYINNTFLGRPAGNASQTGEGNIGIGDYALSYLSTGRFNSAIGFRSQQGVADGYANVSMGYLALGTANNEPRYNTAIGVESLYDLKSGDFNTALGYLAGRDANGNNGIFLGSQSGWYDTSLSNGLYINSLNRLTLQGDTTLSIIYGRQSSTLSNQRLRLNAGLVTVPGLFFVNSNYDAPGIYGFQGNVNAKIYSTNTGGTGIGGVLAFGGKSSYGASEYNWGYIQGSQTIDGQYGGDLSFWTLSNGENGEVATGNYKRLKIDRRGNIGVGTNDPLNYTPTARNFQIIGSEYSTITMGSSSSAINNKFWRQITRTSGLGNSFQIQTVDDNGNNEQTALEITRNGNSIVSSVFKSGTIGVSSFASPSITSVIALTDGTLSTTTLVTQYTDDLARAAISLTTSGTSGGATYSSTTGVLNIPQYQAAGTYSTDIHSNITALNAVSGTNTGDQALTIAGTTAPTINLSGSNTATFVASTGLSFAQSGGTITATNTAPFPGFGTNHTTAAYGDHNHAGVYDNYGGWNFSVNAGTNHHIGTEHYLSLIDGSGIDLVHNITGNSSEVSVSLSIDGLTTSTTPTSGYFIPMSGGSNNYKVSPLTLEGILGTTTGTASRLVMRNASADAYAHNFILSSDRRLKKNIRALSDTKWTDKIEFKQFQFKDDPTHKTQIGVIAQDIEKIAPQLVTTDPDGNKAVAYIDLLIAKISEMDKKINEIQQRLDDQEFINKGYRELLLNKKHKRHEK